MSNWLDRAKRAVARGTFFPKGRLNNPSNPWRRRFAFEALEPRLALAGINAVGAQPAGPLTGKIVFVSPGHGDQYDGSQWYLGRSETQEMDEALGTQDQATFFADYLFRAGATVVPLRPIGRQVNEVVLDNDMAPVTYTGAWSDSAGSKYYDEDYAATADAVHYRFASTSATETATATYTPNITSAGFYPVYAWASASGNRTLQSYKVNHSGGQSIVKIDHSMVGNGWVYLGTYHFNGGSSSSLGSVVISNQGTTGKVVIADAIRFGNGMGDVPDGPNGAGQSGGTLSGKPREDEAALLWCYRSIGQGAGSLATFFSVTGTDPNVSGPARLAEYMYENTNTFGTGVYIAVHSNAFDGTGRGAIGLITNSGSPTPHQSDLALYLGQQVNEDLRGVDQDLGFTWNTSRDTPSEYTLTGAYGEFNADDFTNANAVVEMDASLAEVAFHDNIDDALIMRDPRGRDAIGRALYQAVVQYFDVWGGLSSPVTLPTAPTNVQAVSNTSGQVTLNWSAGPSSSAYGAGAAGYRVYISTDGYGFDGGTAVAGMSTTITGLNPTIPHYFKIVGTNAGGESAGSEVVTALPSGGVKQVLIVNGFDRNQQSQDFRYTTRQDSNPGSADTIITVDRVWARYNNSFDYVVQVHNAINAAKPGIHVASTSNEAVINGAVNLADYDTVIWILGEESTTNETFSSFEQSLVESFIGGGGNFFVSGAEIGWDLDRASGPTAADRSFYQNTLKGHLASDASDDAGTYTVTAVAGGIFASLSNITFSNGSTFSNLDGEYYNSETPDVITPQSGAVAALNYNNGAGAAAIQVLGTGGRGNVVMFGFPFETISNANPTTAATRRKEVMGRILDFFGVAAPVPGIDLKTRVNGLDADIATGPILAAGSSAAFTYIVTNTGNVPLSTISVIDNNGTPANTADDFNPTFASGDTNSNAQIDPGESWTFTATRTVIAGQYSNTGTAAAVGNTILVSDTDPANYFGSAPGISLQTSISGQDANSAPGPTLAAGGSTSFSYQVTNTGNIALASVVVTDNNGTPGNAADDFNPTLASGDTNNNNLLDLGETWTLTGMRTVVAGQFSGVGSVTAKDSINQAVNAADAANYFGSAPGISLQTSVNGADADSPPGPTVTAGGSVTFDYVLINTGNVPLGSVVVWDDNGTPGNASDDFQATYVGGDANFNELLDTTETWTFTDVRTGIAGQYTNTSSASGLDSISQVVNSFDPTSYFVPANADFNSDTNVDAGDYVMWRKNSGITSGALQSQGDANGDGMVDSIDYDAWRSQFNSPAAGAGSGTLAESGAGAAAAGENNQADSLSSFRAVSSDLAPSKDATDANDAVFGALPLTSVQRGTSLRRSVERVRSLAASLPRDWSDLLNDLAERRIRRGAADESAPVDHARFAESAETTDIATGIDCSVTEALTSNYG